MAKTKKAKKPVSEMTPEEIRIHEAIKAKKLRRKNEKRENLLAVLNYVIENGETEMAKIAKALIPAQRGATAFVGGVRTNMTRALLLDIFAAGVGSTATRDEVWAKAKLGDAEMRKKTLLAIKKAEPAERLWISFDRNAGVYKLEGEGSTPPDGWLGFVPMDVEA